jgi:hypothetical protein
MFGKFLEDIPWGSVIEMIKQNGPILNPLISKLKYVPLALGCTIPQRSAPHNW